MRMKRKWWLIVLAGLSVSGAWLLSQHQPEPLVSGKPVAYWLDRLPRDASDGLLPADHPLAKAGPEIVPPLIAAINRSYTARDFIDRCKRLLPPSLGKHLAVQRTPAWLIRETAAFRLGLMGAAASNAVPSLISILTKPPTYVADPGRVIQALGDIGPPARQAVPVLVDKLNDQSEWIRFTAANSLLQIGTVPSEAVPALKRNLRDTGYVAANMAVALLAAQNTAESLSRVELMLTIEGDGNTRPHVAAALAFLPELPEKLKPIMTRMLDDNDASVRQGAAIGLARPRAENLTRIVEVLIEGLKNGQFQIRCAQALGKIGPEAAASKPELERAQGYVLRIAAQDALKRVSSVLSEPDGAANRSQPTRSETNTTSAAAGSNR
jgi:HEAT repeat protein